MEKENLMTLAGIPTPSVAPATSQTPSNAGVEANGALNVGTIASRTRKYFSGKDDRLDSVPNERLSGPIVPEVVIDSKDYAAFNGNLIASENFRSTSINQVDSYIEPAIFFSDVAETHAPSRVNLQPINFVFDDRGVLSFPSLPSPKSNMVHLETQDDQVSVSGDFKQIGWFIRTVRFNTERGLSSISVETNAIQASYDLFENERDGKLVVLTTEPDITLDVDLGTVTDAASAAGLVNVSPSVESSDRPLTAFLKVASAVEGTLVNTACSIKGYNCTVYAYPIIVSREIVDVVSDLFANDRYDELASALLNYL